MATDNSSVLSNDTRNVLKAYLKTYNIPLKLQKEILSAAEAGKSLLDAIPRKTKSTDVQPACLPPPRRRARLPEKPSIRLKSTIQQMGAYEREKFSSGPASILPAKEKERFQNLMAFGKEKDPSLMTKNKQFAEDDDDDVSIHEVKFRQILNEIEERQKFLEDMSKLGEGNKFASQIEFEIKKRIRELEDLDINKIRFDEKESHSLENLSEDENE